MRIALLTPRFWPEVRRGTERHVHDLAVELRAQGHDPVVVTTGARRARSDVAGVRVVRLPRLPEGRMRATPLASHRRLVGPALRALRPDVVHAFTAAEAAAALGHGPVVYTHMGIPDEADLARQPHDGRWLRRAMAGAGAVVALSRHAAAACRETHARDPELIHPGVSLARFAPGTERTPAPSVIYASDGAPHKRLGLLLEAWPAVRERHPDARLLVNRRAGPVEAPGVECVDMDDTGRLAALTGAAWATVLPSLSEAFGLVLAEALATGTPVVATAAGGMPEIVDRPEIGRTFTGGAPELAEAIEAAFALAREPGTRAACRARAEAFDLRDAAGRHVRLYERLKSSGSAAPTGTAPPA